MPEILRKTRINNPKMQKEKDNQSQARNNEKQSENPTIQSFKYYVKGSETHKRKARLTLVAFLLVAMYLSEFLGFMLFSMYFTFQENYGFL